eukprot:7195614-Prymnesium_polylepis.2
MFSQGLHTSGCRCPPEALDMLRCRERAPIGSVVALVFHLIEDKGLAAIQAPEGDGLVVRVLNGEVGDVRA